MEQENQYLLAKIKILTSNLNIGEKDEILLLITLFYLNQSNQYDKLIQIFGEEASQGICILDSKNDEILDINKISKAPSNFKADCMIRMKMTEKTYSVSIKSKNGSSPAILNHTPRNAKVFLEGGALCEEVGSLDRVVAEYIEKRNAKTIGEDIYINSFESLKDDVNKNNFLSVLTYFVFDGSGKGYSKCRANALMTYYDETITFVRCETDEEKRMYITTIYDSIILSLRDKGMPKESKGICEPWIYNDITSDGSIKQKGSLHLRMK